jgi:GT2 family glycosyltransferase
MPIRLSVIIVTYNSSYIITGCLNALMNSIPTNISEIILVDNASSDSTIDLLGGFKDLVKVISLPNNIGFAGGVNEGIAISRGDYILVINPDLIINRECLQGMLDFLAGHENVGAVAPKLLFFNGERQPSCRRYPILRAILLNRITFLKRIFGESILVKFLMQDVAYSGPAEVEWIIGACMMFRRDALKEVGFFDSEFFLYYEDADWCYRAGKLRWKVAYLPMLAATHLYQRESKQGINKQLGWHIMSLIRFYRKHGFRF